MQILLVEGILPYLQFLNILKWQKPDLCDLYPLSSTNLIYQERNIQETRKKNQKKPVTLIHPIPRLREIVLKIKDSAEMRGAFVYPFLPLLNCGFHWTCHAWGAHRKHNPHCFKKAFKLTVDYSYIQTNFLVDIGVTWGRLLREFCDSQLCLLFQMFKQRKDLELRRDKFCV